MLLIGISGHILTDEEFNEANFGDVPIVKWIVLLYLETVDCSILSHFWFPLSKSHNIAVYTVQGALEKLPTRKIRSLRQSLMAHLQKWTCFWITKRHWYNSFYNILELFEGHV